jgi:hypothetical protein
MKSKNRLNRSKLKSVKTQYCVVTNVMHKHAASIVEIVVNQLSIDVGRTPLFHRLLDVQRLLPFTLSQRRLI